MKAANVPVESYWPSLFAKLAEKRNVDDLIMNVGSGGGGGAPVAAAAPAAGGAAAAAAPAAEEKKVSPPALRFLPHDFHNIVTGVIENKI